MVLESLISAEQAERRPWKLFFLGMIYSSIGVFLGLFMFGDTDISLVIVFLTVLSCAILM